MNGTEFAPGAALARTRDLMLGNGVRTAAAVAIMAGLSTLPELAGDEIGLLQIPTFLFFQYDLTRRALAREGLVAEPTSRFRIFALIGLLFVTSFGIGFAFLFLFLPGLYLLARWFVVVPVLIAEDAGVFDSVGRSWRQTRGKGWSMLGMIVLIYIPIILVSVTLEIASAAGVPSFPIAILNNIVSSTCIVAGWHGAVAAYAMLGSRQSLHEVFA